MANNCTDEILDNSGQGCKLPIKVTKRFLTTLTKKADGTYNEVSIADAASLATWTALINKFNFDSDVKTKVVASPLLWEFAPTQDESEVFDVDGYFKKTKDGNYTLEAKMNEEDANTIKNSKANGEKQISVYLLDAGTQVSGRKVGTNLRPFEVIFMDVQNVNLPASGGISQVMVKLRMKFPEHFNDLYTVQIADADYSSDTDFYSLIDVSTAISTPAITGCIATLTDVDGVAVTGLADGDDYLKWSFYDAIAPTVAIPLAAAGSISEGSDGVYTINEAAILTTAHVYSLKVSVDGYDVEVGTVTVP